MSPFPASFSRILPRSHSTPRWWKPLSRMEWSSPIPPTSTTRRTCMPSPSLTPPATPHTPSWNQWTCQSASVPPPPLPPPPHPAPPPHPRPPHAAHRLPPTTRRATPPLHPPILSRHPFPHFLTQPRAPGSSRGQGSWFLRSWCLCLSSTSRRSTCISQSWWAHLSPVRTTTIEAGTTSQVKPRLPRQHANKLTCWCQTILISCIR